MVVCLFCHCLTCRQPLTLLTITFLITRLRSTFGCSGTVLNWYISYLNCRTQSVFAGHESTPFILQCGVSQGSVLGPLLSNLYTRPLSTVICQSGRSNRFFADDSQLHKSSVPSDVPVLACCMKDCIEDVAEMDPIPLPSGSQSCDAVVCLCKESSSSL